MQFSMKKKNKFLAEIIVMIYIKIHIIIEMIIIGIIIIETIIIEILYSFYFSQPRLNLNPAKTLYN